MCIIAICKDRKLTREEFEVCFDKNSDGVGFGWVRYNRVCYNKGFMREGDAYEFYTTLDMLPHIVHFRKTSFKGLVSPEVTHPFISTLTSPLKLAYKGISPILFHNGTIKDWKDIGANFFSSNGIKVGSGIWTDTRLSAALASRCGHNYLHFLGGKYVYLTVQKMYIIGVDEFEEVDGVLFSNDSYKQYTTSYYNKATKKWY